MNHKASKYHGWNVTIRRYMAVSAIGLIICIYFFWRMYKLPVDARLPLWVMWVTGFGGILFLGGLFGIGMSYFFRMIQKDD